MKKLWLGIALTLCFASSTLAQDNSRVHMLRPFATPPQPNGPTISYNGGPVFETAPTVYLVYYGNWTKKDQTVINNFLSALGGTTMDKINATYADSAHKHVPNALNFNPSKDSYHDNYSLGHHLTGDSQIQLIAANAIKGGHLPPDENGIYFVLTAKDVTDADGFCTTYCGYHSPSTSIVTGDVIKYSMVGNAIQQCPRCAFNARIGDKSSPNNDPGADGVVNVIWHEFSETVSDPEVNLRTAWAGNCGESGDCCAWLEGKTFITKNGSHANERIGGHDYFVQEMLQLKTKKLGQNEPAACENTFNKP